MDDITQRLQNLDDRYLTCADCGNTFTWTQGEQEFYISKGLSEPKRCPACRKLRKATIDGQRENNG